MTPSRFFAVVPSQEPSLGSEATPARRSRVVARRTEALTRCRVVAGGLDQQLMQLDA